MIWKITSLTCLIYSCKTTRFTRDYNNPENIDKLQKHSIINHLLSSSELKKLKNPDSSELSSALALAVPFLTSSLMSIASLISSSSNSYFFFSHFGG